MTVLLDTHTVIWALLSRKKLGSKAAAIISYDANTILVSAVTAWEIATKVRLGKVPEAAIVERNFIEHMGNAGYILNSITAEAALRAGRLPGAHRDPFDRILAAQALAADIPILSLDTCFDGFAVRRIW